MEHKTAHVRQTISMRLRQAVWEKYMGQKFSALCYCCGLREITAFQFHAAHVVADVNNGDAVLQNLRPVCVTCNLSCGDKDLRLFAAINGFNGRLSQEDSFLAFRRDETSDEEDTSGITAELRRQISVNKLLTAVLEHREPRRVTQGQQYKKKSLKRKIVVSRFFKKSRAKKC